MKFISLFSGIGGFVVYFALSQAHAERVFVSRQRAVNLFAPPVLVTKNWKRQIGGFLLGDYMDTKICTKCHIEKKLDDFHKNKGGKLGRHSWCKDCFNSWHPNHREPLSYEDNRKRNLKDRYGLSEKDINIMLDKQGGKCAICEADLDKYRIDHDHNNGRVRGLLCHRCNLLIAGMERESFLDKALRYLGVR